MGAGNLQAVDGARVFKLLVNLNLLFLYVVHSLLNSLCISTLADFDNSNNGPKFLIFRLFLREKL